MEIGIEDAIREWRVSEGLAQAEVADMLGISPGYLSQIERGVRDCPDHVAERLHLCRYRPKPKPQPDEQPCLADDIDGIMDMAFDRLADEHIRPAMFRQHIIASLDRFEARLIDRAKRRSGAADERPADDTPPI